MIKLRHVHLIRPHYLHIGALQDHLVRQHLDYKASVSHHGQNTESEASEIEPPPPTLLTCTPLATYNCGRRDMSKMTAETIHYLRSKGSEFFESPRGGQLTWHGPGQMMAYLICDLRRHKLTPRTHMRMLEEAAANVAVKWKLQTNLFEKHPGLWTAGSDPMPVKWKRIGETRRGVADVERPKQMGKVDVGPPAKHRKLASVGVHLRRNISSYGIGINIKPNLSNFMRINACGMSGDRVTSFVEEGGLRGKDESKGKAIDMRRVEKFFAKEIAFMLDGVEPTPEQQMESALWDRAEEMKTIEGELRSKKTTMHAFLEALPKSLPDKLPDVVAHEDYALTIAGDYYEERAQEAQREYEAQRAAVQKEGIDLGDREIIRTEQPWMRRGRIKKEKASKHPKTTRR